MGRPRKTETRQHQLNLSLTAGELESIRLRAEAVGMRPVHFGRAVLLDQSRKVIAKVDASNNLSRLIYGQLARLGNLLNQMMRHCHRSGDPAPADLEPLLADIRRIVARGYGHDR